MESHRLYDLRISKWKVIPWRFNDLSAIRYALLLWSTIGTDNKLILGTKFCHFKLPIDLTITPNLLNYIMVFKSEKAS